jgi:hypothetical protein
MPEPPPACGIRDRRTAVISAVDTSLPDDVLAFLDETVSRRGRGHWLWKYGRGSTAAPTAYYWSDGDGRVLGFIGLMRTDLHAGGAVHPAAWFVDWYVAPGQPGIGVGLLRKAESSAGILLTLQGSADTRQILPRLGWKVCDTPVTWLRPLSRRFIGDWLARQVPSALAPLVRAAAPLVAPFLRRRAVATPSGAELVAVERFPASYDRIAAVRSAEMGAMRRDSDYLNWLCADHPDGGFRLWLLRRHGEDVGHLVTRCDRDRQGRRRGRIVDAAWPNTDDALGGWLLDQAVAALSAAEADYVECLTSRPAWRTLLSRAAFRQRAAVPLWYRRVPDNVPAPGDWHITLLDCDRAYR